MRRVPWSPALAFVGTLVVALPSAPGAVASGASGPCADLDGRGYLAPIQAHIECFVVFAGTRGVRCTPLADDVLYVGEVTCKVNFVQTAECTYLPLADPDCSAVRTVFVDGGAFVDCFGDGGGFWGCGVQVV